MQYLIVGKGAKECALARKIKAQRPESVIFIAPGNQAVGEFATCVDIQSSNVDELIDFAKANEVDLTIISDDYAVSQGIADAFNEAGLMCFGPEKDTARFANYKSVGKRFMYKMKIPTPKFGIFDKEPTAREYLKNSSFPLLIKQDCHCDDESVYLCHSIREANFILNKFFQDPNEKVIIENYVNGREFSLYLFTDGFNAVPICAVEPFKYFSEKDGGSITKGVGAYVPCSFINEDDVFKILDNIVYPTLSEMERSSSPYQGILGIDGILSDDGHIFVIEFNTFFNEPDAECILDLMEDDLINIFKACAVGSLADDYDFIKMKNSACVSVVLTKTPKFLFDCEKSDICGLENLDEDIKVNFYNVVDKNNKITVKPGRILSLSVSAATLNKAKTVIADNIDVINFEGKKYRKDIISPQNE